MKALRVGIAVLLLAVAGMAGAQERRYSEGPVVAVTSVKVMDGQFENYLKFLDGTYKASMEAAKKAGLVLDYWVLQRLATHAPGRRSVSGRDLSEHGDVGWHRRKDGSHRGERHQDGSCATRRGIRQADGHATISAPNCCAS